MELTFSALLLLFAAPFFLLWVYLNLRKLLRKRSTRRWGFFHPFCNDGGGGEKVLWCIVKALTEETTDEIVIYSLEPSKAAILEKIKSRFGITIESSKFEIVHVSGKWMLTSKKMLTMLMHIVLPMFYALKCLWKDQPDIFYDTTGYASTLVAVKLFLPSTTTAAYVHYPFISEEMLQKVREQRSDFNNSQLISRSPLLSRAKLYYYYVVYFIYKLIGWSVNCAQTNSTWTHAHMSKLWPRLLRNGKLSKLYPPCTVDSLLAFKNPDPSTEIHIMSLAQFRPEKQQHLQLEVVAELLKGNLSRKIKLRMCGTTRGPEDEAILDALRAKAKELAIEANVEFVVNQPFSKIEECMQQSWIGFHTMEAEHFGISVVEMLAAGLLVVAHNSAGPRFDIIREERFLADKKQDYASKIRSLLQAPKEELLRLSELGRAKSISFGEKSFKRQFMQSLSHLKAA